VQEWEAATEAAAATAWTAEEDAALCALATRLAGAGGDAAGVSNPELVAAVESDDAGGSCDAAVAALRPRSPLEVSVRFILLRHFWTQLASVLPLVDFTCNSDDAGDATTTEGSDGVHGPPPPSLAQILTAPHVRACVSLHTKLGLWERTLASTRAPGVRPQLRLNRLRAAEAAAEPARAGSLRRSLFGQTWAQLASVAPARLRQAERPWTALLEGEGAEDCGGPYRESLAQLCVELQQPAGPLRRLLVPVPNAHSGTGLHQEMWVPSPRAKGARDLSMLRLLGRLMGVALRTGDVLDLDLPPLVWRPLVGLAVRRSDVQEVDTLTFRSLRALRTLEAEGVDQASFAAYFSTPFTATSMDGHSIVEVVPGGQSRTVGWAERDVYCAAVEAFRARELRVQLAAVQQGMAQVVPRRYLSLFTPTELQQRVCGVAVVDVAELKRTATYSGLSPLDPSVRYFWEALEAFDPAQRRQFLRFVWGRSRLPPRGADAGRSLELQPFARGAAARPLPARPQPTLPLPAVVATNTDTDTVHNSASTAVQQSRTSLLVDAAIGAATEAAAAAAAAAAASESDGGGGSEALATRQPSKAPVTAAKVQYQVCGCCCFSLLRHAARVTP